MHGFVIRKQLKSYFLSKGSFTPPERVLMMFGFTPGSCGGFCGRGRQSMPLVSFDISPEITLAKDIV